MINHIADQKTNTNEKTGNSIGVKESNLGSVAPTVERWLEEPRGAGSNPAGPTKQKVGASWHIHVSVMQ